MMEKEKIKNDIILCINCIERFIKENTINILSKNYKFLVATLDDSFNPFGYHDLVLWAKNISEYFSLEQMCDLIFQQHGKISWVDFIPYRLSADEFVIIAKLVPWGDCSETRFHCSLERYRHYPIKDQKYDINYFWQISDDEYEKREKEWCERCKKILSRYKLQKFIRDKLKINLSISNLDDIDKINVFLPK